MPPDVLGVNYRGRSKHDEQWHSTWMAGVAAAPRELRVTFVRFGRGAGIAPEPSPDVVITYTGDEVIIPCCGDRGGSRD